MFKRPRVLIELFPQKLRVAVLSEATHKYAGTPQKLTTHDARLRAGGRTRVARPHRVRPRRRGRAWGEQAGRDVDGAWRGLLPRAVPSGHGRQ
jgi:hypothetical protein